MQYITSMDYVLLPFYLALVYGIAFGIRNKYYPRKHPWRKYFIPGLTVKIFGAVFIGLLYQYYYEGGDTFEYFRHSLVINSAADESLGKWFNLIMHIPHWKDGQYYNYVSQMQWYMDPSSYAVARTAAFLNIFTFNTYLPTSILFAFISFSGIWALFKTIAGLYPRLHKEIAISVFFIPSVFVWGSGIFKDTICLFALGWLSYCTFRIFIHRDLSFKNFLLLAGSFYLIAVIKIYILLAFLPAIGLWILMKYAYKIKNTGARVLLSLVSLGAVTGLFFYFTGIFAKELNKYSLEQIAQTAESTRGWIYYSSGDEGSAYDLGTFDPSITGMLAKFPQAVVVTLYRPFLWEAKKPIMFLSALEALAFLVLSFQIIQKHRGNLFKVTRKDPNLIFFLVFTLIFAFAVGISSYNFGSLSRYKIPCMPFFAAFLFILLGNQTNKKAGISQLNNSRKRAAMA